MTDHGAGSREVNVKLFHRKTTSATEPTAPRADPVPGGEATNGSAEKPAEVPVVDPTSQTAVVPATTPAPVTTVDRFTRLLDDWMSLPFAGSPVEVVVRDGPNLVVRAEMPGLDPDKDVELSVSDGVLWLDGHHQDENRSEENGYVRHEVRYGAFSRSFPLPDGVTASDIHATYKDGVLEIRIPAPEPRSVSKIPITTS
jgi:HSP20 family protein